MIADRFHDRRVFLCGDAAHIWVPFAGYGMNAGIEAGGLMRNLILSSLTLPSSG
jgi:2-polyprenyl-6-methoxyphenol hydroxylase-like FAD-dependent oxidoreductase